MELVGAYAVFPDPPSYTFHFHTFIYNQFGVVEIAEHFTLGNPILWWCHIFLAFMYSMRLTVRPADIMLKPGHYNKMSTLMIKWWSANIWEKWNINEHLFVFVEKTISNLAKLSL